jgi:hypothetical protein
MAEGPLRPGLPSGGEGVERGAQGGEFAIAPVVTGGLDEIFRLFPGLLRFLQHRAVLSCKRGRDGLGAAEPTALDCRLRELREQQARALQVIVGKVEPHAAAAGDVMRFGQVLLRAVEVACVAVERGAGE